MTKPTMRVSVGVLIRPRAEMLTSTRSVVSAGAPERISTEAAEALKVLSGTGELLAGKLMLIDALTMQVRTVKFGRDPQCTVCGA